MYNFLKEKYQIEELSSIKITPLIYRINTNKGKYIVKEVKDDSLNKIYARMELLNIEYFNTIDTGCCKKMYADDIR